MNDRSVPPLPPRAFRAPDGTSYSYRKRDDRWFVFNFTPLNIDSTDSDGIKKASQTIAYVAPEEGLATEIEADALARRLAGAPPADNEEVNRALEAWIGSRGLEIAFYEPERDGEPHTAIIEELSISARAATQEEAFNALIDALLRFVQSYVLAGKSLPPRLPRSGDGEVLDADG